MMEGGRSEAQEGQQGNGPQPLQQHSSVCQVSAPEPRGWVYCPLLAPSQNRKLGLPSGPLRECLALWALPSTNLGETVKSVLGALCAS